MLTDLVEPFGVSRFPQATEDRCFGGCMGEAVLEFPLK
jgi:hypothetical protein